MNRKLISICIPCFNEEGDILEFYRRLSGELQPLTETYEFEIIFEDNASTDNTPQLLRKLAEKDPRVKIIFNSRNFGPMKNGAYIMFQAKGDAIIGYPCDLQVPLKLIKEYISYWEKGYEVVVGQIINSKENRLMFKARSLYYRIMDVFSDVPQLYHVTGAGLYDKKVLKLIQDLQEPEPDFRFLITELGLNYKLIPYEQPCRKHGKSSYSIIKYYNQALDSFVSISGKTLRYMTNSGIILMIISFLISTFFTASGLSNKKNPENKRRFSFCIILFMESVHIFCLGMLGEYIYFLTKRNSKHPIVVERERINF